MRIGLLPADTGELSESKNAGVQERRPDKLLGRMGPPTTRSELDVSVGRSGLDPGAGIKSPVQSVAACHVSSQCVAKLLMELGTQEFLWDGLEWDESCCDSRVGTVPVACAGGGGDGIGGRIASIPGF
jgi:hypothetical protein